MSDVFGFPASWPTSLPACPNTWSEKPQSVVIRTEMQVGPPKVRRRFTRNLLSAQPKFLVSRQGVDKSVTNRMLSPTYASFMTFFNSDCMAGVRPFYFVHPWSRQLMTWRWMEEPTLTDYEVKFIQINCSWEQI